MALLTQDDFYEVIPKNNGDAAWAALTYPPGPPIIPGNQFGAAMAAGTSIVIYVTDAVSGNFLFNSGYGFGYDDSLFTVVAGPLTKYTLTDTDGNTSVWGKNGGDVYTINTVSNLLLKYNGASLGGFKAFLP